MPCVTKEAPAEKGQGSYQKTFSTVSFDDTQAYRGQAGNTAQINLFAVVSLNFVELDFGSKPGIAIH